ncbi:hypothetical protein RHCRD62_40142 [Rhodococcus sp. RD6.2]|nr:hypothetical protein RHCRD62_40142 [Rhodococcus sp. RD6.2]
MGTEFDLLHVVEIAGRAQDDQQRGVLSFEFGSLVGSDGIVDREMMQVELVRGGADFGAVGPVQTDPGHPATPRMVS